MSAECVAESIPAGYKQTEVGVIPEDWEVRKLEEIADVIDPHPSHRAPPEVTNGIPFVGIGDLNENGEIIASKVRNVAPSVFYEHQKRYDLVEELIGLGRVASIGKVVKIKSIGSRYTISPTLGIIRGTKVKRDYLLYALKSKAVTDQFNKIMSGSTRSAVGMIVLRKLDIFLPTTEKEQESIATALSDTDALIESLEQLIAKKRQIKQGAMQELLRPKDWWIVKNLGEIANIKTGSRNNQDKIEDGEYPFFVRSATMERINSYSYDCEAILVPGEGGIGSIFHYICGRFDVHQRVYAITQFIKEVSGKYVFFYMKKNFGEHAMQNTVKATVDSLRLPTFQNFEITMPPSVEEQAAIATIISDMDAEITALEQKLTKTRDLKQGMMQELLTGRIRLV